LAARRLPKLDCGIMLYTYTEFNRLWLQGGCPTFQDYGIKLYTYTEELLPSKGQIKVDVCYKDKMKILTLIVAEGNVT